MHPFRGTQICPRCGKAVYAAEQVMGPGRKLYHKPCLACTNCNKRLDSFTLLEHDQLPYCKSCHVRNFGTLDLRQANLSHRSDTFRTSPVKFTSTGNGILNSIRPGSASPSLPTRSLSPVRGQAPSAPILKPNMVFNAAFREAGHTLPLDEVAPEDNGKAPDIDDRPLFNSITALNDHREPSAGGTPNLKSTHVFKSHSVATGIVGRTYTNERVDIKPLIQTSTGTRYGAALSGTGFESGSSPKKWGGTTPICPRCGDNVYFAEQVKAIGKTYHKGCLRCTECKTLLDSSRLTEKDGDPLCHRCYGKLHGPAGSGYALLGKAGS